MGISTDRQSSFGPAPLPDSIQFENLACLRAFAPQGAVLSLRAAAGNSARENELAQVLRDVATIIEGTPHINQLVIDFSEVSHILDEARGAIVKLITCFEARGGITFVGACGNVENVFRMMKLSSLFESTPNLQMLPPTRQELEAVDEIARALDIERANREAREAALRYRPSLPEHPGCNGNVIMYRILGDTAVVSINPEVMVLPEQGRLAEAFASALQAVAEFETDCSRVLFNLRGLEFIGADTVGTFIRLYQSSKKPGCPQLALCSAEDSVAEKLRMTRVDKLIRIFENAEAAFQEPWYPPKH